jgi:predicted membrane protein
MCSLLLLQHRVVEVVGFSSSWSFEIGTWSLLLSISSLKLKSCSFINTYIHTSRELHFISLAFYDLIILSFILLDLFNPQLSSCFFERYQLGVSQTCIPSVHLNFLGILTWSLLSSTSRLSFSRIPISLVPDKSRTSEFLRHFQPDLFWVWHLV